MGSATERIATSAGATVVTPPASCRGAIAAVAGIVEELGVRRPWRGHGLGLALLDLAFEEFERRGLTRAILTVDSENPTGATRLYERAGMSVELAWEHWEKELRSA